MWRGLAPAMKSEGLCEVIQQSLYYEQEAYVHITVMHNTKTFPVYFLFLGYVFLM